MDFHGMLTGPASQRRSNTGLVKQVGDEWAVRTFTGPNPE